MQLIPVPWPITNAKKIKQTITNSHVLQVNTLWLSFFSLLSFHFAMLINITILRILWISRHESLTYFWTHECFNWKISSSANCINFARWKPYMDLHDYTFFIECQLKLWILENKELTFWRVINHKGTTDQPITSMTD